MSSDRAYCRQRLHELLRAQYDCAGRLLTVLQAEAEALLNRDVESLGKLVNEKHQLVARFEQLDADTQRLLDAHRDGGGCKDITGCIAWCDDSGQLLRGWKALLDRIARCQQQNRVNGATLDSSRRHAQQALSVLRELAPAPDLYSPAGVTAQPGVAGRSLAKA